jgi:hypothetical protein
MTQEFKVGMKWKWCDFLWVHQMKHVVNKAFQGNFFKKKKKKSMTILLVKWLIQEFRLKINYEIKIMWD